MKKKALQPVVTPKLLKLDLGCGKNKRAGFHGVDAMKFDGVDTVVNLTERMGVAMNPANGDVLGMDGEPTRYFAPWPWQNDSVEEVHCSHFLEHLTGSERIHFFNELHRVLIKGGKATIIVPHWSSERAYGDPTHQWPPVVFFAFYYLRKEWRDVNAPHTGYTCDFDTTAGNVVAAPWNSKAQEVQQFSQQHYINVCQDLICTSVKR